MCRQQIYKYTKREKRSEHLCTFGTKWFATGSKAFFISALSH